MLNKSLTGTLSRAQLIKGQPISASVHNLHMLPVPEGIFSSMLLISIIGSCKRVSVCIILSFEIMKVFLADTQVCSITDPLVQLTSLFLLFVLPLQKMFCFFSPKK